MDLLKDPMKVGVGTVVVGGLCAHFLGLTHLVTLGVVVLGGVAVLHGLLKK